MEYESMKAVGVDAKGRNKIMKRREECTLKTNRGFWDRRKNAGRVEEWNINWIRKNENEFHHFTFLPLSLCPYTLLQGRVRVYCRRRWMVEARIVLRIEWDRVFSEKLPYKELSQANHSLTVNLSCRQCDCHSACVCLYTYLYICLPFYLSVCLVGCLSMYSFRFSALLFICISTCTYSSVWLVGLSICLASYLST